MINDNVSGAVSWGDYFSGPTFWIGVVVVALLPPLLFIGLSAWLNRRAARRARCLETDSYTDLDKLARHLLQEPAQHVRREIGPIPEGARTVLFTGLPGVGKTREAVEFIRQLTERHLSLRVLVPSKAAGYFNHYGDVDAAGGHEKCVVFLIDNLDRHGHHDAKSMEALQDLLSLLCYRLRPAEVFLVATLRDNFESELVRSTGALAARTCVEVPSLTQVESGELFRAVFAQHRIAANDDQIKRLAEASDGTAVTITEFGMVLAKQRVEHIVDEHERLFRREWAYKSLLPQVTLRAPHAPLRLWGLLRIPSRIALAEEVPRPRRERTYLEALGFLDEERIPSTRALHKRTFLSLSCDRPRWRRVLDFHRAAASLVRERLVDHTGRVVRPRHDKLAACAWTHRFLREDSDASATNAGLLEAVVQPSLPPSLPAWVLRRLPRSKRSLIQLMLVASALESRQPMVRLGVERGIHRWATAFGLTEIIPESLLGWGTVLCELAKRLWDAGHAEEAETRFKEAFTRYESAVAIKPDHYEALYSWGDGLCELAKCLWDAGRADEAETRFKEAFTQYESAVAVNPDKHEALFNCGNALGELAKRLWDDGRTDEAEPHFQEAFTRYESAIAVKPDLHEALFNWGTVLCELAMRLWDASRTDEAETRFQEAFTRYESAVAVKPDKYKALSNWGFSLGELAMCLWDAGHADEAETRFQEAFTRYESALAVKPDLHEAFFNWGVNLGELAKRLWNAGRTDEAETRFQEAFTRFESAVAVKPDLHEALYNWGTVLSELAKRLWDAGRADEAETRFKEAFTRYESAVAVIPDKHEVLLSWGIDLSELAMCLWDAGRADKAETRFQEAFTRFESAVAVKPDLHEALFNWGNALGELAKRLWYAGRADDAEACLEQAVAMVRKAVEIAPKIAMARGLLGHLLLQRGEVNEAVEHKWVAIQIFLAQDKLEIVARELRQIWEMRERDHIVPELSWGAGLLHALLIRLTGEPSEEELAVWRGELAAAPKEVRGPLWEVATIFLEDGRLPDCICPEDPGNLPLVDRLVHVLLALRRGRLPSNPSNA